MKIEKQEGRESKKKKVSSVQIKINQQEFDTYKRKAIKSKHAGLPNYTHTHTHSNTCLQVYRLEREGKKNQLKY